MPNKSVTHRRLPKGTATCTPVAASITKVMSRDEIAQYLADNEELEDDIFGLPSKDKREGMFKTAMSELGDKLFGKRSKKEAVNSPDNEIIKNSEHFDKPTKRSIFKVIIDWIKNIFK